MRQEGKGRLKIGVGDALNITRTLKEKGSNSTETNSESLLSCLNTWTLFSLSKQNKAKSAGKNVNRPIN